MLKKNYHKKFMKIAMQLAKKSSKTFTQNPLVGAVIVKNNKILSTGFHKGSGTPHAEKCAIQKALKKRICLKGASLYVNLEPCSHHGETPPCTEVIIKSGITHVFFGINDPNKKASGGAKVLAQHNVYTEGNILNFKCAKLNRIFLTNIIQQRPYFTAKYAITANGKMFDNTNKRLLITDKHSQLYAHKFRAKHQAIITSYKTINIDQPKLTIRHKKIKANIHQPQIIIIDAKLDTSLSYQQFKQNPQRFVFATTEFSSPEKRKRIIDLGSSYILLPCNHKMHIDLKSLSQALFQKKFFSCLIEAGPQLLSSFYQANLVDESLAFISANLILNNDPLTNINANIKAKIIKHKQLSSCLFINKIHKVNILNSYLKKSYAYV